MVWVLLFLFIQLPVMGFLIFALRPERTRRMVEERLRALSLVGTDAPDGERMRTRPELFPAPSSGPLDRIAMRLWHGLPRLLLQAGSRAKPGSLFALVLLLAVAGLALGWELTGMPWIGLSTSAILAAAPFLKLRFARARRRKAFQSALPEALDLMGRALRAGHAVPSAIGVVGEEAREPLAAEFQLVFRQQNFGLPLREALLEMVRRVPSNDLRFVVTAILVQKETGGNLAEILDRTAYVVRERLRIQGEVRIKTAQGRLTGWILVLLPLVVGLIVNLVNPGYAKPLLSEPAGHKMLLAAAAMLLVGGWTIRKIVTIEV